MSEFVLIDEKINLSKGDIIVFPSNFMYPHKVEPVTGTRYSYISWIWQKRKTKVRFHKAIVSRCYRLSRKLKYKVEMVKEGKENSLACIRITN